jgi:hypothetical protein
MNVVNSDKNSGVVILGSKPCSITRSRGHGPDAASGVTGNPMLTACKETVGEGKEKRGGLPTSANSQRL